MRTLRIAPLLLLLAAAALPVPAADAPPRECSLCAGVTGSDAPGVPVLTEIPAAQLETFVPADAARTTLIVDLPQGSGTDPLLQIDADVRNVIEKAKLRGPFDALGVRVENADPAIAAYALKRLSTLAQGLGVAKSIAVRLTPFDEAAAATLFEQGAGGYFDVLVVDGESATAALAFLAEHDPSKKVHAVVTAASPNAAWDVARAFAAGATRAFAVASDPAEAAKLAASFAPINAALTGDWANDSTAKIPVLDAKGAPVAMPVYAFVRGEDLRTLLIPQGDATAASVFTFPADQFAKPRRIDSAGERDITDVGRRGDRLLVGTPATREAFAVSLEHVEKPAAGSTRESIDVATERGITVEEIIRNHQAYDAWQESVQPRYIAHNTTRLRFDIGGGAEALEAAIAGDYFSDPRGDADWVWKDFFINGVKWKYGRIPELPLIQAEKVTQLPLDIHLTNDYRYELVRATDLLGYRVYEVRFEPPRDAPKDLPLYRGTVYIDAKSWARIRITMVQLNLTGEVLSNEERVDFQPFVGSSRVDLQACKLEYSIVSPK